MQFTKENPPKNEAERTLKQFRQPLHIRNPRHSIKKYVRALNFGLFEVISIQNKNCVLLKNNRKSTNDADFVVNNLWMSVETHFCFNDFINNENCRYCLSENPRQLHEVEVDRLVWCENYRQ